MKSERKKKKKNINKDMNFLNDIQKNASKWYATYDVTYKRSERKLGVLEWYERYTY